MTVAAMILPAHSDTLTLAEAIDRGLNLGLVPCIAATLRRDEPWRVNFYQRDRIPGHMRRLRVVVRTPDCATVEPEETPPCAA